MPKHELTTQNLMWKCIELIILIKIVFICNFTSAFKWHNLKLKIRTKKLKSLQHKLIIVIIWEHRTMKFIYSGDYFLSMSTTNFLQKLSFLQIQQIELWSPSILSSKVYFVILCPSNVCNHNTEENLSFCKLDNIFHGI